MEKARIQLTEVAKRYLPVLDWGSRYDRDDAANDLVAAVIVTIMLIPQSLAYALLAGLPAEMGLYASILPLVAYAIFGTSRALAVGPVAVVSLMTATAIGKVSGLGIDTVSAAITLAFLSGVFLLVIGVLRLGFLANFLSHPVISGFITASGIIIAASQLKHILGVKAGGDNLVEVLHALWTQLPNASFLTFLIGAGSAAFLFWVRKGLKPVLQGLGVKPRMADLVTKAGPVAAVAVTILLAWAFNLGDRGVRLVGDVPQGLPPLSAPSFSLDLWVSLIGSAVLISVIGFVESVSVAQTLAAKKRQRIDPDQELVALGASNVAASVSGGYPVTGGFARSVVNFDAGAATPAAGAYTAVGIAAATLILTPLLAWLPQATLAATIIVAVLSLVDFSILPRAWRYSKADFSAVTITIVITLLFGVEMGVSSGVLLSILIYLYRTSKPHMAVVGQVPGTEHFRNVLRHKVITDNRILSLRVDESLYFANARYLEDKLYDMVAARPELEHVILMCPAVNSIDISALESLEAINEKLSAMGVTLHMSEIKGPVMDKLLRTDFFNHLSGKVYLHQYQAISELTAKPSKQGKKTKATG